MEGIKIEVTGNIARVTEKPTKITSGTVGLPVEFSFDSPWDSLSKVAVFRAGKIIKNVRNLEEGATVPWEVLVKPNVRLSVGVYGVNADGSIAIPTIWANVIVISCGTHPEGDASQDVPKPVEVFSKDAVLYTDQKLTDREKTQARENIGAAAYGSLDLEIREPNGTHISEISVEADYPITDNSGNVEAGVVSFYERSGDKPCVLRNVADGQNDFDAATIGQLRDETYGLVPIEFEVGNLASSNGGLNPAPNNDRLRSRYIDLAPVLYIASTDETYPVYVYAFAADRRYLGTMGGWFEKVEKREILDKYPTAAYFRVVVKKFNNTALTPEDVYGKIVCMRSKFITEPLNVAHPHAQYFQVTWNGIISLKPEFRGEPTKNMTSAVSDNGVGFAGSRNEELPEHLVIPEMVGNTAVTSIADGAFYSNMAIKTVTFPKTLNVIPMYCFRNTLLESIENAEHVTTIGEYAFHNSNLHRAYFPKLQTLGTSAFCQCSHLTYAHIGKVTEIPKDAFFKDRKLSCIDSECLVTSVGNTALYATSGLTSADFVKNLKSIGIGAFIQTGLDFDWGSLTDCTVESHGTPDEYNPTNFWSGLTPTACKNPLPTHMCQSDPRWVDRVVFTGFEDRNTWEYGCQLFAIMHIYCGLNQLYLSTVKEIEDLLESIQPGYLHNYGKGWSDIQRLCEPLGISVTEYAEFNAETLQALYDALKNGKYAIIGTSSGDDTMVGHVVVAYGVTANGKLLIADSGYQYRDDKTFGAKYSLPYKSVAIPKIGDITFCILSKEG